MQYGGHGGIGIVLDSEESKNVAVVHKTNQGYSGKDLWRLKQEKPELFGGAAASGNSSVPAAQKLPAGFQVCREVPGWLFNADRNIYLNPETGQHACRDPHTREFYVYHRGQDISSMLAVRGDAAACSGSSGGSSRHVIINDLHRAARSMNLDLAHLDSPAAMFAIYDAREGGAAAAEAAAKGLHGRLLPRLAAYRGLWEEDQLKAMATDSIEALGREIGAGEGVGLALALLVGRRLTLASTRGAVCKLFRPDGLDASTGEDDVRSSSAQPEVGCIDLANHDGNLGICLTVDAISTANVSTARLHALVRPHVASERLKAACIAVLEAARGGGATPPLVAAAIRLAWTQQDGDLPPSKRPRTDQLTKVRCRHILLRHLGSQQGTGERGKKKVTRTQWEAEAEMLAVFGEVTNGGPSAFTTKCRALSECDTALRGGDLAGDLGWLDKDPAKNRKIPIPVVRAAFGLVVGQLSDVVSSERGVHLILRTA